MTSTKSREETARALLERAHNHIETLRRLWERGAIETSTTDQFLNGFLANVNAELESEIRAYLAAEPESEPVALDSPDSVPRALEEFAARDYKRINRGPAEEAPLQSKEAEYDASVPPIWETIAALGAEIPDSEWAKIPTDLASNFDKYAAEEAQPGAEEEGGDANESRDVETEPGYRRDTTTPPVVVGRGEQPGAPSDTPLCPQCIGLGMPPGWCCVAYNVQPGAEEPLIEDHEFMDCWHCWHPTRTCDHLNLCGFWKEPLGRQACHYWIKRGFCGRPRSRHGRAKS